MTCRFPESIARLEPWVELMAQDEDTAVAANKAAVLDAELERFISHVAGQTYNTGGFSPEKTFIN